MLTSMVEEAVTTGDLVQLLRLEGGRASIVETKLAADLPRRRQAIYELRLPTDAAIVAVLRDGHVVIPQPETVLAAGDELVALAAPEPSRRFASRDRRRLIRRSVARFEAVAHPRLGDEVAGRARVGLELAPDLRHVHPEVVRLVLVLRAPHLLQELALTDQLPGLRTSISTRCHSVGVSRTSSRRRPMTRLAARSMVNVVGRDHRLPPSAGHRAAARRAHAGEQLAHPERLGHVVVGARRRARPPCRLARRAPTAR